MPVSQTHPTRRRWFQIGLRGLLVIVLTLGVGLGLVVRWHASALRQKRAVMALNGDLYSVRYEGGFDASSVKLPIPSWLQGVLGPDHFYDVVEVYFSNPTDDQMRILRDLPRLERITLPSACNTAGFKEIGTLKHLTRLDLAEVPALDDECLAVIGSMNRLKNFSLTSGENFTDAGLVAFAGLQDLEYLTLRCGLRISDRALSSLGALHRLKHLYLDLDDPSNISAINIPNIAGTWFDPAAVQAPRGRDWEWLRKLTNLDSLWIRGGHPWSGHDCIPLSALAQLRKLNIDCEDGLTDAGLSEIGTLRNLESLRLCCGNGSETAEGWAQLQHLAKLSSLHIRMGEHVGDAELENLAAMPKLHSLVLRFNDQITGEGLAALNNLEFLHLAFESRSKRAPPFRLHLPNNLAFFGIDGDPELEDNDLVSLTLLPNLHEIRLYNCERLTDQGLDHLIRLSQLQRLTVSDCKKMTEPGIKALRAALPACQIDDDY